MAIDRQKVRLVNVLARPGDNVLFVRWGFGGEEHDSERVIEEVNAVADEAGVASVLLGSGDWTVSAPGYLDLDCEVAPLQLALLRRA